MSLRSDEDQVRDDVRNDVRGLKLKYKQLGKRAKGNKKSNKKRKVEGARFKKSKRSPSLKKRRSPSPRSSSGSVSPVRKPSPSASPSVPKSPEKNPIQASVTTSTSLSSLSGKNETPPIRTISMTSTSSSTIHPLTTSISTTDPDGLFEEDISLSQLTPSKSTKAAPKNLAFPNSASFVAPLNRTAKKSYPPIPLSDSFSTPNRDPAEARKTPMEPNPHISIQPGLIPLPPTIPQHPGPCPTPPVAPTMHQPPGGQILDGRQIRAGCRIEAEVKSIWCGPKAGEVEWRINTTPVPEQKKRHAAQIIYEACIRIEKECLGQ